MTTVRPFPIKDRVVVRLFSSVSFIILKKPSYQHSGSDCDFRIKTNTDEEVSKIGIDHVFNKYGVKKVDFYIAF